MPRTRTQKSVSQRIDLNYFKHPSPLRTGRKVAAVLAAILAGVVVAAFSLGSGGGHARLHNPGPLTAAHAQFQNDCRACHDGGATATLGPVGSTFGNPDAGDSLSRHVSDAACLVCHDGSVHNTNQKLATLTKMPSPGGDPHLVTAGCVSCHIEHRGREVLLASTDATCTSCHADLPANSGDGAPTVARTVTAFAVGSHPGFGRNLPKDSAGKWQDSTALAFNHKKHNAVKGLTDNCNACHAPLEPQPAAQIAKAGTVPPWIDAKDRPTLAAASSDRRVLGQVSYARSCVGCHTMTFAGLAIPHEELATVRSVLADAPARYAAILAAMPDADRAKALETTVVGPPPLRKKTVKKITADEWVAARMTELATAADKAAGSDPKYAAIKTAITPAPPAPPASSSQPSVVGANANLLEYAVTYGMQNNCAYCHTVRGNVPAVGGELAATVPTGIPAQARRWFSSSVFSHYAHRAQRCNDCHQAAWTSEATSDVLSPDMTTGARNCVSCHKPDDGVSRGAPAGCQTCHVFHDPLAERGTDGAIDPRTGQPLMNLATPKK